MLGVLGELLLTAGVLLGLFLVWQLWWTDVMADREQTGILDGLEQEWGAVDEERIAPRQDGPPPVPATPEDTEHPRAPGPAAVRSCDPSSRVRAARAHRLTAASTARGPT